MNELRDSDMKIYDLSKELFTASVFPGDPSPEKVKLLSMEKGDACNMTKLTLGVHNGTHIDAPGHFIAGGSGVDGIDLNKCVGPCRLVELSGEVGRAQAEAAIEGGVKRLLIKGKITLTAEAARVMTKGGILFLGVEGMTVGDPEKQEMMTEIHRELLSHEVVILESAIMEEVPQGDYFLVAQPMKMARLDGSPARPLLISGL